MQSPTGDFEAPYASQAINRARKTSKIAIATAQLDIFTFSRDQMYFLRNIGIQDNDQIKTRKRGQMPKNNSFKENMLQELISSYNPEKVLFFDDMQSNLIVANSLGIKTQLINNGITKKEFESGMKKVNYSPELVIFDIDKTLTTSKLEKYTSPSPSRKQKSSTLTFVIICIVTIMLALYLVSYTKKIFLLICLVFVVIFISGTTLPLA